MYMIILDVKVLDLTTGDVGDVDEHIVIFHMTKIGSQDYGGQTLVKQNKVVSPAMCSLVYHVLLLLNRDCQCMI
jgi:hypothetical protein